MSMSSLTGCMGMPGNPLEDMLCRAIVSRIEQGGGVRPGMGVGFVLKGRMSWWSTAESRAEGWSGQFRWWNRRLVQSGSRAAVATQQTEEAKQSFGEGRKLT